VSLDKLIESRIQDAAAAGAFEGLPGAGRPQHFDPADDLAGDNWMGFKILRDGGMLPSWLMLARDIEQHAARLERTEVRFREWVALAAHSGDWEHHAPAIRRLHAQFVGEARELRKKQDRFNVDAPSVALERPAIWVDARIQRLDEALRSHGAPPALFPWVQPGED
jgi:hypothetical protein